LLVHSKRLRRYCVLYGNYFLIYSHSCLHLSIGVEVSLLNFCISAVFSKCLGFNPFDSIAHIAPTKHIYVAITFMKRRLFGRYNSLADSATQFVFLFFLYRS
jgi:hypothetical protein